MPSFKINSVGSENGPSIFGSRLKVGLIKKGWVWNDTCPDYNIVFAAGQYVQGSKNILRLDNIYFDSENTIGDTDKLNAPIRQAYEVFDKIIFQSHFALDQYRHYIKAPRVPYKVIYNGVPDTFSKKGLKVEYRFEKVFICSADWRAHKRLNAIINAFKCFPKNKNYGLVVLGNCKYEDSHLNIVYPGKVHPSQLSRYLRGADVGVHLSWLDCSPNSVYEMLACGLPVLCSHNGGTKEIVREDGIVLKLESDYKFKRVALYKPPEPDIDVVYWGMQEILGKKVNKRSELYIDHVVDEYIEFMVGKVLCR